MQMAMTSEKHSEVSGPQTVIREFNSTRRQQGDNSWFNLAITLSVAAGLQVTHRRQLPARGRAQGEPVRQNVGWIRGEGLRWLGFVDRSLTLASGGWHLFFIPSTTILSTTPTACTEVPIAFECGWTAENAR
jgi:hypothetical protein